MKWAIFIGGFFLAVGAGVLLRRFRRWHPWLVGALGFLPFFAPKRTSISVIFDMDYARGDTMGLEVTLIDFVAVIVLIATRRSRNPYPYRVVVPLYVLVALISIPLSVRPDLAFFGFWKLLRMVLLLVALAGAFQDPRSPGAWLRGASLGVLLQFYQAFQQRFIEKLDQAMGTFPHQNSMAMAVNLIVPIVLALLLAGQGNALAWTTLGCGVVCVVLSLSRGALAMLVVALVATYLVSVSRRTTARKGIIALSSLAGVFVLAIVSLPSIIRRFESAPEESAAGRRLYEQAAALILHDHPFGIGINQWSFVSDHMGYAKRVGLEWQDIGGIAHHIYWLTAAEFGYHGFVVFVLLLAAPFVRGAVWLWRDRDDIRADVLGGLYAGLLAMDAQGVLEWNWRQTQVGYLYWSITALVFALSVQLKQKHRKHTPSMVSFSPPRWAARGTTSARRRRRNN